MKQISLISLILLITGAIDSIRNLPATAWFGPQLIFFFIFSALIFLIPVALVSAELSSIWSEEDSGVYGWVKAAFGKQMAFLTIWFQWINTMVWYPSILLFISSVAAYLISPDLAQHKIFSMSFCIGLFWLLTGLSLKGLHTSAKVAGFCAILGMIIPMLIIIILGLLWFFLGQKPAVDFSYTALIPNFTDTNSWISLTAIMTSFLGMELAAVHVREIKNPQKNYPKAIFYSVILILITMILGSLSIAVVLPRQEINLVLGSLQTAKVFLQKYHLQEFMPILAIMIFLGCTGSMINWVVAPSKGMSFAAEDGFIPRWLAKRSEDGQAKHLLIVQAVFVTILCSAFILLPNINAIYWFFTALSTEIYMLMYVLMFIAAIVIKSKYQHLARGFKIPGKNKIYYLVCALGLLGCSMTIYIGFFPPEEALSLPHPEYYKLYFGLGLILVSLPALISLLHHRWKRF